MTARPERSLSDLFSSSRAATAMTGCGPASPRCGVFIIASVDSIGRFGSDRKAATPASVLSLGIEDVQDGADQQRVAGLLPVVPLFERPFGIDQDVGDVLNVADFPFAAADLEQRIVGGRPALVGSNSSTPPCRARKPAVSCQFSPLMS